MARVLIVEDDVSFRAFLREALVQEGYEVLEAHTGVEGLRLIQESPVSLVVTDILMPDVDGLQMIREIRQRFPQTKIVAISGGYAWSGPPMLELAQRLGADLVFDKPEKTRPPSDRGLNHGKGVDC